jgi:multiple sugar transport system permease protein
MSRSEGLLPVAEVPGGPRTSVAANTSHRSQKSHGTARTLRLAAFYLLLSIIAAVFIAPYVLSAFAALKPLNEIFSEPAWIPPSSFNLHAFAEDFTKYHFLRYLGNTALVTVVLTVGQVLFSIFGAWAFARLRFPGRETLFWIYLLTLMVPNVVTLIPLYTLFRYAHMLNTYWAIFLPYSLGTPYTIFLMRQFFLGIPSEVIEAARIDGCSELRVLWQVGVPLARPIIVTAVFIAFVFGWNNFLWPLIVTNSPSLKVLTVGIASFQSNLGTQWNLVLAGSLIALIPLLIIFAVFQKQIVRSIQLTSGIK